MNGLNELNRIGMDGWMDWMDWIDGWIDRKIDRWMDGLDGWMHRRMDGKGRYSAITTVSMYTWQLPPFHACLIKYKMATLLDRTLGL